ncbi:MAG: hypothetical protein ACE5F5_11565 [Acidimicrobiia bacterium]
MALDYFRSLGQRFDRPVLPESTHANELLGGCVAHFGFTVLYAGAGGVYSDSNETQQGRLIEVVEACRTAMQTRGLVSLVDDIETRTMRYEAYLAAYECLIEIGLVPEPPPSLDAYLDGALWYPFDNVGVEIGADGTVSGPRVECAVP